MEVGSTTTTRSLSTRISSSHNRSPRSSMKQQSESVESPDTDSVHSESVESDNGKNGGVEDAAAYFAERLKPALSIRSHALSLQLNYGSHPDQEEQPQQKHVAFGRVQIREYPIGLGDNPGGTSGPPLTILWRHQSSTTLTVDDYEANIEVPRRMGAEMCIPAAVRQTMLMDAGYSRQEIVALTKPVNIARQMRRRCNATCNLDPLRALSEKARRTAIDVATLGNRKRQERKFLEPFRLSSSPSARTGLFKSASHRSDSKQLDLSQQSHTSAETVDAELSADLIQHPIAVE